MRLLRGRSHPGGQGSWPKALDDSGLVGLIRVEGQHISKVFAIALQLFSPVDGESNLEDPPAGALKLERLATQVEGAGVEGGVEMDYHPVDIFLLVVVGASHEEGPVVRVPCTFGGGVVDHEDDRVPVNAFVRSPSCSILLWIGSLDLRCQFAIVGDVGPVERGSAHRAPGAGAHFEESVDALLAESVPAGQQELREVKQLHAYGAAMPLCIISLHKVVK